MMYSIFFSKKKLLSGIFRSLKNLNFDRFKNFFEIISFIKKNKNIIINFQSLWVI